MKYQFLEVEVKDKLATVWLNRPPSNDFTPEFLNEVVDVHNKMAVDDDIWVIILASRVEKFFSNGMDPNDLLSKDIEGRAVAFSELFGLFGAVYNFPKPEACVVSGHAMAGGAVLGVLTDLCILGEGKHRYSFSEVRVGLSLPPFLLDIIEEKVGRANMNRVVLMGEAFRPHEAQAVGLADQVFPAETLMADAEKYMRTFIDLPQKSVRSIKKNLRRKIGAQLNQSVEDQMGEFKQFLGADFEEGLTAVVEKRRPKYNAVAS